MGELYTAISKAARSDVSVSDQGEYIFKDKDKIFCIERDPYIIIPNGSDGILDGFTPPDNLVRDWKDIILNGNNKRTPQAWEECSFEERYKEYLSEDKEAQQEITKIEMVIGSNNVCLVSPVDFYEYSTRRVVYEYVSEEVL